MKLINEYLKNWIINFGAAILVMYIALQFIVPAQFMRIRHVAEAILALSLITLLRMFTDRFDFKYYLLERLLDCALVTIMAMANWWYFGWERFLPKPLAITCCIVIYLLVWYVHTIRTRREIADIKKKIRQRKNERDSDVKKYINDGE